MATTDTTQPLPSHSDKLWLSSQAIIIQAEGTLFRVHADTLSQNSELFRDLLTLPQPVDAESIDETPVLRIEGTSADDMELFLLCLHSPVECVLTHSQTSIRTHSFQIPTSSLQLCQHSDVAAAIVEIPGHVSATRYMSVALPDVSLNVRRIHQGGTPRTN